MKIEDRSPEEVSQERCARGDAWELVRKIKNLKNEDKAAFCSPSEEWILPAVFTLNPRKECLW